MASLAEIYNFALIKIGDDTITLPGDENTDRGKACNRLYPLVRDAVARTFPWNCLKVRESLAPLAEAPDFGYSYQYTLPTDPYCLWIPKNFNLDLEYIVEGCKLLTDEATVNLIYIGRELNTAVYDSLLVDCIATRLAAELAQGLTAKTTLAEQMWKLYQYKINEAYFSDSCEGDPQVQECNVLLDVR